MPGAACLASGSFHVASKACTEFVAPASDRLVRHDHAALEESLLNVAQTQLEAKIPTHGATDNTSGETVTLIQRL
jgi:hypothetical protein